MINGNQLQVVGQVLSSGEYDNIATVFSDFGFYQGIVITLPYGFTLEVESPEHVSEFAWDRWSLGAFTSFQQDCGALVLSLGRLEVKAFKLIRALIVFGRNLGLMVFVGPDPVLMTPEGQELLKQLRCDKPEQLCEMALDSLNTILLKNCKMNIEIHSMGEIRETYNALAELGFVKQMLTYRDTNGYWAYPSSSMEGLIKNWCHRFNELRHSMNINNRRMANNMMNIMRNCWNDDTKAVLSEICTMGRDGYIYDNYTGRRI